MFKVATLVAVLTVISKILGLVRDLVIAHYFGTSMLADAFNMAYLFTGNFFIIFGGIGGPFYSSIVASLPKLKDPKQSWSFIKDTITKTFLVLILIAAGMYLFKAKLLSFFIDGAAKPEYFNLTLRNIDILLPLIIICGPIGIIYAILNCYKKYYEPSLSPGLINIALIATVFLMGDVSSGIALALGTSIGGILALGFQMPSFFSIKEELLNNREASQSENNNDYYSILYPALMSTGLSQIIVFVDSFFCKGLEEGSWTALVLANRLIQMPMGVLLTAFLVPIFPKVSELVSKNDHKEIKRLLKKALMTLTALCLPAVVIGALWSEEIIRLIFERGAFNAQSTAMVSSAFFYLCFSVIPYVFKDSFTRTLYSFGDSRSPMFAMIFSIIVKIALNFVLVEKYGLAGIAIATSIIALLNALILFVISTKRLKKA